MILMMDLQILVLEDKLKMQEFEYFNDKKHNCWCKSKKLKCHMQGFPNGVDWLGGGGDSLGKMAKNCMKMTKLAFHRIIS